MNPLRFSSLRTANSLRLPQFKNSKGDPAHCTDNGSDWSPAEWFMALIGECGEFASLRVAFDNRELSPEEYEKAAGKELADIATYLDILAYRAKDQTTLVNFAQGQQSEAQDFMALIADLGEYANLRKKLRRGDVSLEEFENQREGHMLQIDNSWFNLRHMHVTPTVPHGADQVATSDPDGFDLGLEVTHKFNEVSKRVGVQVFINGLGNVEVV